MSTIPTLTLQQAIKIKKDFSYLEGKTVESGGLELTVSRVVVAPDFGEEFSKFLNLYHQGDYESRNDEDRLAQALRPRAYLVFVFYYDIDSVFIYENIFDAVNTFKRKIDLTKYNIS